MPTWTYRGGQNEGRSYGGSGMVDDKGNPITSGGKYAAAKSLAKEFKNRGRLIQYSRKVPVYSGPAAFAANYVPVDVKVSCRIEILPQKEEIELLEVPEAMRGEEEPSDELSFQHGLKEGDYVKLHFLSSMTCQWQKMTERDRQSLLKEIECEEKKKAANLPESPVQEAQRMGNEAYRSGDCDRATALYTRALELGGSALSPELSATLHNNRAQALLARGLYPQAVQDCDAALAIQPMNVKAHLRRARALSCDEAPTRDIQAAVQSLERVLELEPKNKFAIDELACLQKRLKNQIW